MKKRICIVAPSLRMGGIERNLSFLANYFSSEYSHEVHYVTMFPFTKFYDLNNKVFYHEPYFPHKGATKVIYYFRLLIFIRQTIKRIDPDVILSFGDAHNPIILLALVGTKYPHYISDRSSPEFRHGFILTLLRNLLYPTVRGIIAQTIMAADKKKKMLGSKFNITVIPNPVSPIILNNEISKKDQIVYIGRLHSEKGVDLLIKAFAQIEDKRGWKLVIVGYGVHEHLLRKLVNDLGLSCSIEFIGKTKEVNYVLTISKIFAFTSRGEGYPTALVEAMAAGLACISFDLVAGPSDIIEDGVNGILVKNGDVNEFSQKLYNLMIDKDKRDLISKNATKIIEKNNIKLIGKRYLDFILEP